jgi:hypothetical protein
MGKNLLKPDTVKCETEAQIVACWTLSAYIPKECRLNEGARQEEWQACRWFMDNECAHSHCQFWRGRGGKR